MTGRRGRQEVAVALRLARSASRWRAPVREPAHAHDGSRPFAPFRGPFKSSCAQIDIVLEESPRFWTADVGARKSAAMGGNTRSRLARRAPLGTWLLLATLLGCSRSSLGLWPGGFAGDAGGASDETDGDLSPGVDGSKEGTGVSPEAATQSDAADDGSATNDAGYDPPSTVASALQLNAAHDGTIDDPLLVGPLVRLWSVSLPQRSSYPIVARDTVVVVTSNGADGSQAQLWAFHGHTGAPAWGPINLGARPTELGGRVWGGHIRERPRLHDGDRRHRSRVRHRHRRHHLGRPPVCAMAVRRQPTGASSTRRVPPTQAKGSLGSDEDRPSIVWQAAATADSRQYRGAIRR